MNLTKRDLQFCMTQACAAAQKSGRYIAKNFRKEHKVLQKEGGNTLASQVVTEVDVASQKIILDVLKQCTTGYDLGVLTEESVDDGSRFEKDYFWAIDPLDGTLPFVEGSDGFAVSIALVTREGAPVLGVVYNPLAKSLYHAMQDGGAFKNGKPWVPQALGENCVTLVCDRSFLKDASCGIVVENLQRSFPEVRKISHGGAVMNAIWVLENAPAVYMKYQKKEEGGGSIWDFAATAAIFAEVGADVSDIVGRSLVFNRKESTFMNHSGIRFISDPSSKIISLVQV